MDIADMGYTYTHALKTCMHTKQNKYFKITDQLQSLLDIKALFLWGKKDKTERTVKATIKGLESRSILESSTQEHPTGFSQGPCFENPDSALSVFILKHKAFYTLALHFSLLISFSYA